MAADRRRGRRSRAESERTRTRILARAERMFARRGYGGVSLRELAHACGLRQNSLHHHFGSKLRLFEAALCRWDREVEERVTRLIREVSDLEGLVGAVIDELFDFFLDKRDWIALNVRATLGEGLPRRLETADRSWARFIENGMPRREGRGPAADVRLLLITIEGILHNHVLARSRYRGLFGSDVADPVLRARVKAHLRQVLLSVLYADRGRAAKLEKVERRAGGRTALAGEN